MPPQRSRFRHPVRFFACAIAGAILAACDDFEGSAFTGSSSQEPEPTTSVYAMRPLVSDGSLPADTFDRNLISPWGIVFVPSSSIWVVNNATGTATRYGPSGVDQPQSVSLPGGINGPAAPTGVVFNTTSDFVVSRGSTSAAASLIAAGEGGTLLAWAPTVDAANALIAFDDGSGGAVYKALAIAAHQGANRLYATDFRNGKVDVFNGTFQKVTPAGAFLDPTLPADYAPFGIQALSVGGETVLFVTYAQRGPGSNDNMNGAGLGLVNIFDTGGTLVSHFVSAGGQLNAPWGIALAPEGFGALSNTVLIGNFGDGVIHAFDPADGAFVDSVKNSAGQVIATPGLRGIAFGSSTQDPPAATLFFAASIANDAGGLFGRIDLVQDSGSGQTPVTPQPPGSSPEPPAFSTPPVSTPSDTTPPTVQVTIPGPNATATNIITVLAAATDNVGVVSVEFFAGSFSIGVATRPPFQVDWDTRSAANGSITLLARARDAAGNIGTSAPIPINVSNVP